MKVVQGSIQPPHPFAGGGGRTCWLAVGCPDSLGCSPLAWSFSPLRVRPRARA